MARSRHALFIFVALAALVLVAGAAADSKGPSGAKDRSKLPVAPVCSAVKDAAKSFDACVSFREGLCTSVKSDSCDLCSFLQEDDGCDLQTGADVTAAVEALYFNRISPAGARFVVAAGVCTLAANLPPAGTPPMTCTILADGTVVVAGTCPTGSTPISLGCHLPTAGGPIVPGSSTAADIYLEPTTAQCSFPSTVTEGVFSYVCLPVTADATPLFKPANGPSPYAPPPPAAGRAPAAKMGAVAAAGKKP